PSELAVLCTDASFPHLIALDLLSQAEHDELASVGLFSSSEDHIQDVARHVNRLIPTIPRRQTISRAWESNAYLVHYRDINKAVEAINIIAPEHMELIGDESAAAGIFYPGVIYMGPQTPVAMGDYYIGTNHVLPTAGAGRFTGGLSVDRFTKKKVTVKIDGDFIKAFGDNAEKLARIEGLPAHGEAIRARKELE
ncbi:MAG: histidinol dehydrogenase, partial [Syntrophorhabdus sp.]